VLTAFLLFERTPSVDAANATWTGTTNSTWSTGTNWSATPVPGTGDTATFNSSGNGQTTLDLGAGITIRSLIFDTASAAAYTIGSGSVGSQTLTLDNGASITVNSTVSNSQLFNSALTLGNDGTTQGFSITNNSTAANLTIAGAITGSSGTGTKTLTVSGSGNTTFSGVINNGSGGGVVSLTKGGLGTLTLNSTSNNGFTGSTTVNGGTLNLLSFAPSNAGVFLNNGTILLSRTGSGSSGSSLGAGTINIGDGSGAAGSALLKMGTGSSPRPFSGAATLNIYSDG